MKIGTVLLGLAICGTAMVFGYQSQIKAKIVDAYRRFSSVETVSVPNNNSAPTPAQIKGRIDLLLQQKAQMVLSQPPLEDELSEEDKLQKLNDALHRLDSAEDEYDRELAVMELGALKGAEAKQGISTALHDASNLVVSQALRQINKRQDPTERTELLLIALRSHNDDIVEQTLLTITEVEDKKLIARLRQLSNHQNSDIRHAAKLALNLAP